MTHVSRGERTYCGAQPIRAGLNRGWSLGLAALAMALSWVSIALYRPPAPRDASTPEHLFSAARAQRHLEFIAQTPHPLGSPANLAVREYLLAELRGLGLEPMVQSAVESIGESGPRVPVNNIVLRKAGTANSKAILLCTHYDSAPGAPGAGDAGASVAAVMETLRALQHGEPLKNDLIVLLTDGEEYGLLGAKAFARRHPWAGEIGLVCNFDARGTRGPSIMFETTPHHAALIRGLATGATHVFAASVSSTVYERMPNGTDFTVFRHVGLPGLNFAHIHGVEHYHQATDTVENLSLGTLQHTGDLMLQLTRYFGQENLPLPKVENAVYFNLLGPWFVHYPARFVWPLALVTCALLGMGLTLLRRRGHLRLPGLFVAFLLGLLAVAAGGCVGWATLRYGGDTALARGDPDLLIWAALAVGAGALGLVYLVAGRWCSNAELAGAAALLWTLLGVLTSFGASNASYLFIWPALFGGLGLILVACCRTQDEGTSYPVANYAAFALLPLSAIVLVSPVCSLIWTALPPALPAIAAFAVLVFWPILPAIAITSCEQA